MCKSNWYLDKHVYDCNNSYEWIKSFNDVRYINNKFEDTEIRYLLSALFNRQPKDIPTFHPILQNWIYDTLMDNSKLTNSAPTSYVKSSKDNIYNFSLAKTNVFLKGIKNIAKYSEPKEKESLLTSFSNLTLSVQQGVENHQTKHITQNLDKVIKYPNQKLLIYKTEGDSKVRPEHAKLNNTVRQANDSFWKTSFHALQDWNCRCSVHEAPEGSVITGVPRIAQSEKEANISDIDLQSGKVQIFSESLPVFKNTDPLVRKSFRNQ